MSGTAATLFEEEKKRVIDWSEDDVERWLASKPVLSSYAAQLRSFGLDGKMLVRGLSEQQLDEMHVDGAVARGKLMAEIDYALKG